MEVKDQEIKEETKKLLEYIKKLAPQYTVKITHVCGTHEQALNQYGIRSLLPKTVQLIAGPGCPVCVVPAQDIDEAIELALKEDIIVTTFGDMSKVPASRLSLFDSRTEGADVRIVYSPLDAVAIARENPNKEVVFFAIGFETTIAIVAAEILHSPPNNFSVLSSHRLIPPAMHLLMGIGELHIDGFLCPGHVATIIGVKPFELITQAYNIPTVVGGFEPSDILMSIAMLLKQLRDQKPKAVNQYTRFVKYEGNLKAQKMIDQVFEPYSAQWRGIGRVRDGGYEFREEYQHLNARKKFNLKPKKGIDIKPGCICHLIVLGKETPDRCKLFGKDCTPTHPYGPCMVSREGTCNIWHKYGRLDLFQDEI
ncbi:MAG TPA: hydrogenase formation protein HypD [Candidatus Deferrimicrobium sp.]|nr:hydrogenase formation protein HypD [Candidatus Deferrimicrobium sp.]